MSLDNTPYPSVKHCAAKVHARYSRRSSFAHRWQGRSDWRQQETPRLSISDRQ